VPHLSFIGFCSSQSGHQKGLQTWKSPKNHFCLQTERSLRENCQIDEVNLEKSHHFM